MHDVVRFRLAVATLVFIFLLGLFPLAEVDGVDRDGNEVTRYQALTYRFDPGASESGQWFVDDGSAPRVLAATAAWVWVGAVVAGGVWVVGEAWSRANQHVRVAGMVAAPLLCVGAVFLFGPALDMYFATADVRVYFGATYALWGLAALAILAPWAWSLEWIRQWKERKRVASAA